MDRSPDDDALQQAQGRLRGVVDGLALGVAWLDVEGAGVAYNPALARLFGHAPGELDGRVAALLAPRDDVEDQRLFAELLDGAIDHYRLVRRYVRADGQPMWGLLTVTLGESAPGRRVVIRALDDITDRQRAQERVAAQHAVARILSDAATLGEATPRLLEAVCRSLRWDVGGLWLIDRDAGLLRPVDHWHAPELQPTAFLEVTRSLEIKPGMGIAGQAWAGGVPVWIVDLPHAPRFPRALAAAAEGLHGAFAFPIILGGEVLGVMDFFSREIRQPDAELLLMFSTIGSQIGQLIERKRAEEDLHRLAAQLSAAEDAQRRRLARDIHDSLGQGLSVVKMDIESALREPSDPERREASLARTLALMTRLIEEARTLTFDLYPSMLDDLGLVPTLHSYVEQQAGGPLAVSLTETGERRELPAPVANYLFRAIKELFTNARKHALATEVLLAVHWRKGALRIMVADDGTGFDPEVQLAPERRRGLGLADLRERIRSLGGQLLIESRPGQGAQIILDIPLDEAAPCRE
ncbi:MAG: GAF domain-containing protein [Byssovorax sp.]